MVREQRSATARWIPAFAATTAANVVVELPEAARIGIGGAGRRRPIRQPRDKN